MMHLTCVNSTKEELRAVVEDARARGIKNILALRGDPPGGGEFQQTEGGFEYSRRTRRVPPRARRLQHRHRGLSRRPHRVQGRQGSRTGVICATRSHAGADFVITQLFFDNDDFYRFHDHLTKKLGATVPIIPGLLPVLSRGQTKRFTALCGAALPEKFLTPARSIRRRRRGGHGVRHRLRHGAVRGAAEVRRRGPALLHAEQVLLVDAHRAESRAAEVKLRVYAYAGCDTCRKALKFLAERKVGARSDPDPRTAADGRGTARDARHVGGELRRLFNTSGQDYRAMKLGERLPAMSEDEALALLAANGNLVKRPVALTKTAGVVGFKPEEWERLIG